MQEKTEVLQEIETAVAAKRAEQRMMMILLPVILLFITLSSPEYTGALYKNLAGVLVMSAWSLRISGCVFLVGENCSDSGVEGVKMRKWKSWKEHRSSILAVAVFTLLSVMLFISQNYGGEPEGTVSRQGEGEPTESRTFTYETADGESQQIDLEVHPVERENAEVQQLLEQAVEEWEAVFLGENKSENEITGNLVLENTFCDGLVQAVYESSDYTVIQDDGTVANEQVGEDGVIVTLQAEFSYADISRTEIRALQVMPPVQGSSQWLRQQVQKQSGKQEAKSRTKETFQLPQTAEGQKIYWKTKETSDWYLLLLLGGAAVVCLEWQKKDRIRRQAKHREACLNREYPQMVEQLSLLMGVGLTLRRTWERILEMDRKMQKKKGYVQRIYMKEMHRTYLDIRKGMGEREAYEQLARRIGLPSYRRLVSILNRNLEKGTRDVCEMLGEEAREAWEIRKNQARKAGEEAGMKLLFPMMLVFVLILVMLLFPAVQSFSL